MRGWVLVLKEVPNEGRPHDIKETSLLVMLLVFFLLFLLFPSSSLVLVSLNNFVNFRDLLAFESLEKDVIFNILEDVGVDVSKFLSR